MIQYTAYWGTHNINPHPHLHDKFEIYLSMNNHGDFFLQETRYSLKIGQLFLIRPFQIHHGFSATGEETSRYVVQFAPEMLQFFSTPSTDLVTLFQKAPQTLCLNHQELFSICHLWEGLLPVAAKVFGKDLQQNILFAELLLRLSRIFHKAGPALQKEPAPADQIMMQILQYIHENYARELSLEEISKALYLSRSRLCKLFKEHTGFTIGNYITIYRLQLACSLLEKGVRVKDVGEAVGFQTYSHFIRTFTEKLGESPKKFSQHHQTIVTKNQDPKP